MKPGERAIGLTLAVRASVLVFSLVAMSAHAAGDLRRYIVELRDAPLAAYDGSRLSLATELSLEERLAATGPAFTGARKLDLRSPESRAYLSYLDQAQRAFELQAERLLGRSVAPVHRYRVATNGMALDLRAAEAELIARSPMVASVSRDTRQQLQTDAGPEWIGAAAIWTGQSGFTATRGESVVIGIIDSGINWEHSSFSDPAPGGYDHVNPFGQQLGLCSDPEVSCNDKVIGVYDFVEDDPDTDFEEENTKGRDNGGHGSHVSGIAAGNRVNVTINGGVQAQLSGVAPNANIVSYRVCFVGDPPGDSGCMGSAILAAIDQAIEDGVAVINYSIGASEFSPWTPGTIPTAFLNARNAGIFVVTSGGNAGPKPGTVGSPANAPWVVAAANATHNRIFGSLVQDLSGGSTPVPDDIIGASLTGGIGKRRIVHAKDFGFALCGTGTAELQATCSGNKGTSNPWAGQTPFNGEIVVCDRGTYGRVEKGKNVLLAGAGGYILANTDNDGESITADEHCLPATHIGDSDGDLLRAWLAGGSNHQGALSGFVRVEDDKFADRVNSSSSRGPAVNEVQEVLKPDLISPGTEILSALNEDESFGVLSGTSMASPHVAGAAALVRAVHPEWNVSQVVSALETTATAELAIDYDDSPATPHERGAGRPRLGEAVNAGLYLNVTGPQFSLANPGTGGDPGNLNLPGLVESSCVRSCTFTRTVTDQMGGGSWQAHAVGFPPGVQVSIAPASFSLASGASRQLGITVDLSASGIVGEWVFGGIELTAAGSSDQVLTVAVLSSGGDLPDSWNITDDRDSGWADFELSGLTAMPDATFASGGLVRPIRTIQTLTQDPTAAAPAAGKGAAGALQRDDPFDGGEGVFTVWHDLPQGGLWLHGETLSSTAQDLDLFVGRDDNQDGDADEEEKICESTSPQDVESCDLFDIPAGDYWIVVQNWDGTVTEGDEVTLISGAVGPPDQSPLFVAGPGVVEADESFSLRLGWSDLNALSGEEWFGAVGVGTRRDKPNNIGVIPVRLSRNGIGAPQTLPLVNGRMHRLALPANSGHDRTFIDVPPGTTALEVQALGRNSGQNEALSLEVFRQDFAAALASPPFAQLPAGLASIASATGSNGRGPRLTLTEPITPGRYFIKLANGASFSISASIMATAELSASSLDPHRGLWDFDRNIAQGAEWNGAGNFDFTVWYAYDDDRQPTWYIASGPSVSGNIWTADLLRVTNNGAQQQENRVGSLAVTFIDDDQAVYSYHVLGQSGFDPMHPNGPNTCPTVSGSKKSYTGHWYRGVDGLGGSTVLVYSAAQAQVHYLFDTDGVPRWLIAADDANQSATARVIPLLQFEGFCATCTPSAIEYSTVGDVERSFTNEGSGSWTLDFDLQAPLSQDIRRTDSITKLSDKLACE